MCLLFQDNYHQNRVPVMLKFNVLANQVWPLRSKHSGRGVPKKMVHAELQVRITVNLLSH